MADSSVHREESSVNKAAQPEKVKITVGSSRFRPNLGSSRPSSSSNAASASSSSAIASATEELINFGDNKNISLAEICSSNYGRKIKRRRVEKGDVENKGSSRPAPIHRPPSEPIRQIAKTTGPRVEFVDGKMVIKESSLEIGQDSMYGDDNYVYEEVEETGNQSSTTYASFRKRPTAARWGIEETHFFYQCLRQCGLNFSLMQTFFPGRTRDCLKKKYQREEKAHPELIEMYLKKGLPLDLEVFSAFFGDDKIKDETAAIST